jgi:hypothetical protein
MRTTQRDQGGTLSFGADVTDAASGAGVAQPGGIPFTFTRTGAGQYTYNIDPALRAVTVTANVWSGQGNGTAVATVGQGTFSLLTFNNNTATNARHWWNCTARRT